MRKDQPNKLTSEIKSKVNRSVRRIEAVYFSGFFLGSLTDSITHVMIWLYDASKKIAA